MQKLKTELKRLYLADAPGQARAIALAFRRLPNDAEDGHWERLCIVANALQVELGLPAPAVSISGDGAYGLWLSLAQPVAPAQAQEFAGLLAASYGPVGGDQEVLRALPPRQNATSGQWAAFINPGMGVAFAGDEGLEMEPPEAGQVALLEGLESISPEQFAQALSRLRQAAGGASQAQAQARPVAASAASVPGDLLLKDATLEDIVRHLHAKNIEPTFRFLTGGGSGA